MSGSTSAWRGSAVACVIACLAVLSVWFPHSANADMPGCLPAPQIAVTMRIAGVANGLAQRLYLRGGPSPALQLIDPATGKSRWSAGRSTPATQLFPEMWAGFAGSLTALDMDGDGLHDRVYAGDLAGRVWRFDIHNGAPADAIMTGGILAELGNAMKGRGFLAPPDVSLSSPDPAGSWLNIAIGTASLTTGAGDNRFYVLRDRAAAQIWTQAEYERHRPIRETDLVWLNEPAASGTPGDAGGSLAGFYLTFAGGSVVSASISLSGRAIIAVAHDLDARCSVAVTVSSVSLHDGSPAMDLNSDGRIGMEDQNTLLPGRLPTSAGLHLPKSAGTTAPCLLGDTVVPGCAFRSGLTPIWWRREDAD